ncbi:unnamed protein product, partial [Phaeothamnion confervicola]
LEAVLARLFVASVNGRPTVVLLDNAHLMDAFSWCLLLELGRAEACPCLFVVASQPMDERRWSFAQNSPHMMRDKPVRRKARHYFRLLRDPSCRRYELQCFTRDEVRAALTTLHARPAAAAAITPMTAGGGGIAAASSPADGSTAGTAAAATAAVAVEIPEEVVERVLELSGGSPYWTAEIASFVQEVSLQQFMADFMAETRGTAVRPTLARPPSSQRLSDAADRSGGVAGAVGAGCSLRNSSGSGGSGSSIGGTAGADGTAVAFARDSGVPPQPPQAVGSDTSSAATAATEPAGGAAASTPTAAAAAAVAVAGRNVYNYQKMIVHRLERRSVKEQAVARHAGVVGLLCPLRVLIAVLPQKLRPVAREALNGLVVARFLEVVPDGNDPLAASAAAGAGGGGGGTGAGAGTGAHRPGSDGHSADGSGRIGSGAGGGNSVFMGAGGEPGAGAGTGDAVVYRFVNRTVQQAVYSLTPPGDRRKIHAAIARVYETELLGAGHGSGSRVNTAWQVFDIRGGAGGAGGGGGSGSGSSGPDFASVALHYLHADVGGAKVVEFATKAAAQALVRGEHDGMLEWLGAAIAHAESAPEVFEIYTVVSEAQRHVQQCGGASNGGSDMPLDQRRRRSRSTLMAVSDLRLNDVAAWSQLRQQQQGQGQQQGMQTPRQQQQQQRQSGAGTGKAAGEAGEVPLAGRTSPPHQPWRRASTSDSTTTTLAAAADAGGAKGLLTGAATRPPRLRALGGGSEVVGPAGAPLATLRVAGLLDGHPAAGSNGSDGATASAEQMSAERLEEELATVGRRLARMNVELHRGRRRVAPGRRPSLTATALEAAALALSEGGGSGAGSGVNGGGTGSVEPDLAVTWTAFPILEQLSGGGGNGDGAGRGRVDDLRGVGGGSNTSDVGTQRGRVTAVGDRGAGGTPQRRRRRRPRSLTPPGRPRRHRQEVTRARSLSPCRDARGAAKTDQVAEAPPATLGSGAGADSTAFSGGAAGGAGPGTPRSVARRWGGGGGGGSDAGGAHGAAALRSKSYYVISNKMQDYRRDWASKKGRGGGAAAAAAATTAGGGNGRNHGGGEEGSAGKRDDGSRSPPSVRGAVEGARAGADAALGRQVFSVPSTPTSTSWFSNFTGGNRTLETVASSEESSTPMVEGSTTAASAATAAAAMTVAAAAVAVAHGPTGRPRRNRFFSLTPRQLPIFSMSFSMSNSATGSPRAASRAASPPLGDAGGATSG